MIDSLPPPPPLARDRALFLDVDGTLVDFAPTPDAVQVRPDLVETLGTLHRGLQGALALISGRPLAQLDALFAPLQLPAAGLHGLEPRGMTAPAMAPPALATLRAQAQAMAARFPGAVVEDKGATLALHWRGNPDAETSLRALADAALPTLPGYRAQPGNHVVELRPEGADKGAAIAALLDTPAFRDRSPVFVGDDLTDEHGFAATRARGGSGILVGDRRPTAATHTLPDIAAVHSWLRQAARTLS
ncbi:MAG: trehalose-phosphatase [Pseudomonadota bacterium]|nr:trehalose-phosphatase [Pseudomonadota bacterium]